MKRTISIAALLVAFLVPQADAAFLKTVAAAQKKAKEKNQLIFVDMFAEWCTWCHRFDKEVVPSEAFQNATDGMVLLRLDTEDGDARALVKLKQVAVVTGDLGGERGRA